jgi:FG-GAP-like repeat
MIRLFSSRFLLVFSIATLSLGSSLHTWAQFETRATSAIQGGAFSLAAGDFNGDHKTDVAIIGNGLSVLLGNGDGTFQPPTSYKIPLSYSLAVADFNGDGKLDIAVANLNSNPSTVSVYLGNGDGTFKTPILSNTTAGSYSIAVGDFNNDRVPDLVLIDPPYVSVLLGNGDGTFQPPNDNNSFAGPQALAVGDFNGDHKVDVLVAGSFGGTSQVGVLLGNGDGTLQSSLTYVVNSFGPESVAVGDFNRDGKLDAAVGTSFPEVIVLLGRGDGSFQPEADYSADGDEGSVQAADLNGDGILDLSVTGFSNPSGANQLLGVGDGTFQSAQFFPAGKSVGNLWIADLNGDQQPDLVLSDRNLGVITLLNTGALSFSPSTSLTFPAQGINSVSVPQSVTLTNTGLIPLSIKAIKASGPFKTSDDCESRLASGASCNIKAVFEPNVVGSLPGAITLIDSASAKPQFIELSGEGTALQLLPIELNFGLQKVGTASQPQRITVTNKSNSTVTLTGNGTGGREQDEFSEKCGCGPTLAAGNSCTMSVRFTPAKTGARTADAYINISGGISPTVSLTGTGT